MTHNFDKISLFNKLFFSLAYKLYNANERVMLFYRDIHDSVINKYQIKDDIDTNILFIKYLNMIINQSKKENRFRIPHAKLIKMIDDKCVMTHFFQN